MPVNVCVLASGSSGNSTAIWTDNGGILIDCGCSKKYIEETLESVRCDVAALQGLLVSHGHSDHIGAGAVNLSRGYGVPLYIHETTFQAVCAREGGRVSRLDKNLIRHHAAGPFSIGDFGIEPFPVFHSGGCAGETFGFRVSCRTGGRTYRIGYLTDTGKIDENIIDALLGCNVLVLEANHDPLLVEKSDRHYLNKKWILSDYGHLNNGDAARAITAIYRRSEDKNALRYVFVAHISRQHNTIDGALRHIEGRLKECGIEGVRLLSTHHRKRSSVLCME